MSRVIWSDTAEAKRDRAIEFIARSNLYVALEQLDEIHSQTQRLLRFPNLGRPSRRKGLRDLSINRTRFVVSYRAIGDNIQILYFRHTSQRF